VRVASVKEPVKTVSQPRQTSIKKDVPLVGKKDTSKIGKKVGMAAFAVLSLERSNYICHSK
jgi:hypothetical protein